MAKIVLGIATSHGPLLSTPPELWGERAKDDRRNRHFYQGKQYSFDDLTALRAADGDFMAESTLAKRQARHAACQQALAQLAEIYDDVRPDVAVIVGDDQMEVFTDDVIPAITIYCGSSVDNIPLTEAQLERLPPGVAIAEGGHCPPERTTYETVPVLGRHIVETLIGDNFDVASSKRLPTGPLGINSIPHAHGFIYRQIMHDAVTPNVPIMLNTFYPPNQPRAARCFDLGAHLVHAIQSWKSDARVALFASGGLTHFVIDEVIDQIFLDSVKTGNYGPALALDEGIYQSGTSEIKNWIAVAGSMETLGFAPSMVEYVPCYRSEAGTGCAMGFVAWQPA